MYFLCKILNGIKSMYIDSLACVREKLDKNEWFRINSGLTHWCIMSPYLFNVHMDGVMKEVKMGMGRKEVRFLEEGREWRLPGR